MVALGDTLPFLSSPASMRSTETVCRKSCWISSSRAHCTFTGRQAVESQSRQLAVPKPKRKSAGLKRGAEVCTGSETEAPRRRSEISDDWLNDGLASLEFSIVSPFRSFPDEASAHARIDKVIVDFPPPP